ncbi:MAG: ribosome small subunit-dependent GTPase A [Sphaerochaetaceae bacterium]|nr:ribosome small subunit-dependent GTPase A [Sphaerochaetaceae bacterium]
MNNNKHYITTLYKYGWDEHHSINFEPFKRLDHVPVRICMEGQGVFRGTDGSRQILLECSGGFRSLQDMGLQPNPVPGDWCAVKKYDENRGLIEAVLPRTKVFHKPVLHDTNGIRGDGCITIANIDMGAIVIDSRYDFNLHRIDRLVALLSTDEIRPLLILTKIDLIDNIEAYRKRVLSRFQDLPVFMVDSLKGTGIKNLLLYFRPRQTIMLIGLSGAGKSTLVNSLCDRPIARTKEVRDKDGRGKHTTTNRQLYLLPNGSILFDTPGLRVLGMNRGYSEVSNSFPDIAELAKSCRYSDCSHTGEPGCAIKKALSAGELEQDRFLHYLQLCDESHSIEKTLTKRNEKDKALGKVKYLYRRGK